MNIFKTIGVTIITIVLVIVTSYLGYRQYWPAPAQPAAIEHPSTIEVDRRDYVGIVDAYGNHYDNTGQRCDNGEVSQFSNTIWVCANNIWEPNKERTDKLHRMTELWKALTTRVLTAKEFDEASALGLSIVQEVGTESHRLAILSLALMKQLMLQRAAIPAPVSVQKFKYDPRVKYTDPNGLRDIGDCSLEPRGTSEDCTLGHAVIDAKTGDQLMMAPGVYNGKVVPKAATLIVTHRDDGSTVASVDGK